jgi:hypothetical protein
LIIFKGGKEMKKRVVNVVEKSVWVYDTYDLKVGDAYIMTVGDDGLEIFDDILSAGQEVFILIESFNENEIKAVYIPCRTDKKHAQRFLITPDMNVTLERVCE